MTSNTFRTFFTRQQDGLNIAQQVVKKFNWLLFPRIYPEIPLELCMIHKAGFGCWPTMKVLWSSNLWHFWSCVCYTLYIFDNWQRRLKMCCECLNSKHEPWKWDIVWWQKDNDGTYWHLSFIQFFKLYIKQVNTQFLYWSYQLVMI